MWNIYSSQLRCSGSTVIIYSHHQVFVNTLECRCYAHIGVGVMVQLKLNFTYVCEYTLVSACLLCVKLKNLASTCTLTCSCLAVNTRDTLVMQVMSLHLATLHVWYTVGTYVTGFAKTRHIHTQWQRTFFITNR